MRTKTILKALFVSYGLTGIFLLLIAFLLYRFDTGEKTVLIGITLGYFFSCFTGGFLTGRSLRKDRYLWGALTGLCYYLLLLGVSFAVQKKWDMTAVHAVTTLLLCTGGGTLGGMLS